jgi:hypothetical protein
VSLTEKQTVSGKSRASFFSPLNPELFSQATELLANGGQGEIFVYLDQEAKRNIVVKRIARNRATMARRPRELQFLFEMQGTCVLPLIGWWNERDYTMIALGPMVMSLRDMVGRTAPDLCMMCAAGLLVVLRRMFALGIVHCDIKPENVLYSPKHGLCLADWGSACRSETRRRVSCTAIYAAPEARSESGLHPVTPASDAWSMALTLYELLTGQAVFKESPDLAIAKADPQRRPPVDGKELIFTLIARCLSPDPTARLTAENFLAAMQNTDWLYKGELHVRVSNFVRGQLKAVERPFFFGSGEGFLRLESAHSEEEIALLEIHRHKRLRASEYVALSQEACNFLRDYAAALSKKSEREVLLKFVTDAGSKMANLHLGVLTLEEMSRTWLRFYSDRAFRFVWCTALQKARAICLSLAGPTPGAIRTALGHAQGPNAVALVLSASVECLRAAAIEEARVVHRCIGNLNPAHFAAYGSLCKEHWILLSTAFGASESPEMASHFRNDGYGVHFRIRTDEAPSIMGCSVAPHQREVMFGALSAFQVENIEVTDLDVFLDLAAASVVLKGRCTEADLALTMTGADEVYGGDAIAAINAKNEADRNERRSQFCTALREMLEDYPSEALSLQPLVNALALNWSSKALAAFVAAVNRPEVGRRLSREVNWLLRVLNES